MQHATADYIAGLTRVVIVDASDEGSATGEDTRGEGSASDDGTRGRPRSCSRSQT